LFNLVFDLFKQFVQMKLKLVIFLIYTFSSLYNYSYAQNDYTGVVTTVDATPILGANISIKGKSVGTVTDFDGVFSIKAESGDTLIISYLGFNTKQIELTSERKLSITLEDDVSTLDEVVLIGYGTQKKSITTSSVSTVSGEEITREPVANVTQALQGKAAGVQVIASDAPGVASTVLVRGLGSINAGREPLYVVDGVLTNNINNINPADIESMNILKDAASLAIYGNRGANGVIIIKTKSGRKGKMNVSVDSYAGIRDIAYRPEMANAASFVTYSNEAALWNLLTDANPDNDNNISGFFATDQPHNTNWLDQVSQLGIINNQNVSVSGGTEDIQAFFSAGLNQEQGMLKDNDFERFTIRSNVSYELSEKMDFSHNVSVQLASVTPRNYGVFTSAYKQAPIVPVRDENGRYGSSIAFNNVANPVAQLELQDEEQKYFKLQGSFKVDYQIIKPLTFTSRFSIESENARFYNFDNRLARFLALSPSNTPASYYQQFTEGTIVAETALSVSHTNNYRWFFDNYVNFDKTFKENHTLKATLGLVAEENRSEGLFGFRINVPSDPNLNYNLDLGNNDDGTEQSGGSFSDTRKLYSYIARFTYDYKDKYILNGSYRRDAANFFQEKFRFGDFFAFSGGWFISNEEFMQDGFFDKLKLRASYGELGNQSIPQLNVVRYNQGVPYPFGQNQEVQQGGTISGTVQEDLSWESTFEFNLGLEFVMFDYKLDGEIDLYKRVNDNALMQLELPDTFGFDPFLSHVGEITNTGIEFMLNWSDEINDDLSYNLSTVFSHNKNELTEIRSPFFTNTTGGSINNGQYTKLVSLGQPLGSFFLYEVEGIDDTGQIVYKDLNGDGTITEGDRRFFGSFVPTHTLGLNLAIDYKNFDFNLDTFGSFGHKVYNGKKAQRFGNENIEQDVFNNRWTTGRPSNTTPRASNDVPLSSNYFLESGDFLRINNLTLGYTVDTGKMDYISNLRVYTTAKNPLILKRFSGFTPELPGAPLGDAGIELDAYPTLSSFFVGLNITF